MVVGYFFQFFVVFFFWSKSKRLNQRSVIVCILGVLRLAKFVLYRNVAFPVDFSLEHDRSSVKFVRSQTVWRQILNFEIRTNVR
jgi:hypothetical protein